MCIHKGNSYYSSMMDGMGTVEEKDRFPTTREDLDEFASGLPEESKVAIEASTSDRHLRVRMFGWERAGVPGGRETSRAEEDGVR